MAQVSFDSIEAIKAFVGRPAVSGEAIEIDQAMIDTFAGVTQDRQWIHVDPARAAVESPFGKTIAHGLLTLSLITGWYHRCFAFPNRKMALNYGFDKVRFTSPVPSGSRLVGSFQLARVEDVKPDEVRCFWTVKVQAEGAERPAMVADWLMQVRY
jgi:acyl dehydratase